MEKVLKDLQNCCSSSDLNEIKRCLNLLAIRAKELPENERKNYSVDQIIRTILRNHPCVEILDKISDILILSRTPSIYLDELDHFLSQQNLAVPALMLIFEIRNKLDVEFPSYYERLEETICLENAASEGYLILLMKSLQGRDLYEERVISIVMKLVDLTTEMKSSECIKILYSIIVILRMHPGCFQIVKNMKKLYIFLESIDPIANIARRIFIEAENPSMRPDIIFLENFSFPDI